jgi:hypothetical protein
MKKSKPKHISGKEMFEQFTTYSVNKTKLQGEGDTKSANRNFDLLMMLAAKIRRLEDGGSSILNELIVSHHESTRLHAAYLLIPINPDLATDELKKLAKTASDVFILSSARTTLEEWTAGRLDTDWFMKKY